MLNASLFGTLLIRYIKFLKSSNLDSFTLRRYRFLQKLNNPKFAFAKFDYILVDELQDCTIADYEVFYKLVKNSNNIVLAGDLAQSIRLGTTSRVPRADDEMMKRFDRILLEGLTDYLLELANVLKDFQKE
ncbi:MAG: UvrD-helicase domain-containing protein [Spirosomataceae bacterium]